MRKITRHNFLKAAGTGALALGAIPLLGRFEPFADASPRRVYTSSNGVLRATLTLAPGQARIGDQIVGGMLLYNGLYPGPVLRARPGDRLQLTVRNGMNIPTNTHFHGLHVSPLPHSDYIFLNLKPGQTYTYDVQIPADHPGGLNWFHPHRHMYSDQSVYSGLAGLLVIEGGAAALPELQGVRRRVFALQSTGTKLVDGAVVLDPLVSSTAVTTTLNGHVMPTLHMRPGETQFWQFANASNQAYYRLAIPGHSFTVVEEDGSMRWVSEDTEHLLMPAGKRFGIVVTAPRTAQTLKLTTTGDYQGPYSDYRAADLATIVVAGDPVPSRTVPKELAPRTPIRADEIVKRRVITLSESYSDATGPLFYVNRMRFDHIMQHEIFKPVLGTAEEWVIRNAPSTKQGGARESHPFHIHVNDFQVVAQGIWDPKTNTQVTHEQVIPKGTMDTVNVRPDRYVVLRMRFTDFVGATGFHCHTLFHEDHGMMSRFDIIDSAGDTGAATRATPLLCDI